MYQAQLFIHLEYVYHFVFKRQIQTAFLTLNEADFPLTVKTRISDQMDLENKAAFSTHISLNIRLTRLSASNIGDQIHVANAVCTGSSNCELSNDACLQLVSRPSVKEHTQKPRLNF